MKERRASVVHGLAFTPKVGDALLIELEDGEVAEGVLSRVWGDSCNFESCYWVKGIRSCYAFSCSRINGAMNNKTQSPLPPYFKVENAHATKAYRDAKKLLLESVSDAHRQHREVSQEDSRR